MLGTKLSNTLYLYDCMTVYSTQDTEGGNSILYILYVICQMSHTLCSMRVCDILTYSYSHTHTHILTYSHTRIVAYSHTHILAYSHSSILTYSHTRILA
jgi:hypothetical protein